MRNLIRKLFSRGIKKSNKPENSEFTEELSYLNDIPKLDIIGTINLSDILGKTIIDIEQEFSSNKIDNWMDYSMTFITLNDNLIITFPVAGNSYTSIVKKSKKSKRIDKKFTENIIGQKINDFYCYFFENIPDSSQPSYLVLSNGYVISGESIGIHGTGMADLFLYSKEEFEQIVNDKETDFRSFQNLIQ